MPKIKLKPNVHGVEIGIGSAVKLKFAPGETAEVTEGLLAILSGSGNFEIAEESNVGIGDHADEAEVIVSD